MAGFHHPLRLGTMIRFGSLEFMSLGIKYDMIRDGNGYPKPDGFLLH
jgi:hypothetical protein